MFGKLFEQVIEPLIEPLNQRWIDPLKKRIANLSQRKKIFLLSILGIAVGARVGVPYYPYVEQLVVSSDRMLRIETSPKVIPLSKISRRTVADKAAQLRKTLAFLLDGHEDQAWTRAQIIVALANSPTVSMAKIDAEEALSLFEKQFVSTCDCWKKYPQDQYPPHIAVSAWVAWALSTQNVYHPRVVGFLLKNQNEDGSWPMFAGTREARFASSYATSLATLAIYEQMNVANDDGVKKKLDRAVQAGAQWLVGHGDLKKARWADYPLWPGTNSQDKFVGISGFVLYTLHRLEIPDIAELDQAWLENLPADVPPSHDKNSSDKTITLGTDARNYTDDVRYYSLPWAIVGTIEAYEDVDLSDKFLGTEWFERAVAPGGTLYEISGANGDDWIAAENLFALEEYEKRVASSPTIADASEANIIISDPTRYP